MSSSQSFVLFIGRALMGILFLVAGVRKAFAFTGSAAYMSKNGVPMAEPLLVLALFLEIVGGLALIVGWNVRWVATALAIFVIVVTPIFHGFWNFPPEQYVLQLNMFLKNLAVIGGLFYIAAFGAGGMSIDGRGRRR